MGESLLTRAMYERLVGNSNETPVLAISTDNAKRLKGLIEVGPKEAIEDLKNGCKNALRLLTRLKKVSGALQLGAWLQENPANEEYESADFTEIVMADEEYGEQSIDAQDELEDISTFELFSDMGEDVDSWEEELYRNDESAGKELGQVGDGIRKWLGKIVPEGMPIPQDI